MAKTKISEIQTVSILPTVNTPFNPFSETLMSYINGVYSPKTGSTSFNLLINYFASGEATPAEVNFLVTTNNNYIVRLLNDLREQPEAHELLRSIVGQVVLEAESNPFYDFDFSEDESELTGAAEQEEVDA